MTGTAVISLTALRDDQLAEGEEMFSFRLGQPAGIQARLDQNLQVTNADVSASPCAAVDVMASPVGWVRETGWRTIGLDLRFGAGSGPVQFEWTGPFRHDESSDEDDCHERWSIR